MRLHAPEAKASVPSGTGSWKSDSQATRHRIHRGTRFTATREAPIHQSFKEAMVAADERGTDLIFRSYRNTARVARNEISQQVVAAERDGQPFEAVANLVKGVRGREGLESGDINHGVWTAGLVQGLINDIPTCEELLTRMVAERMP